MDLNLANKYMPYIYYDKNEPFFPIEVGYTIIHKTSKSPSFNRVIKVDGQVDFVIEYAFYFNYDSQHLFDLEHVWIYVDGTGNIADCEASFHGKYLKGLLIDRSNIEEKTHVRLYSQPGKHAFMPKSEYFHLLPNLYSANDDEMGKDGLLITDIARGRYFTNDMIHSMVRQYIERFKFVPSMIFEKIENSTYELVLWEELDQHIPLFINKELERIKFEMLEMKGI